MMDSSSSLSSSLSSSSSSCLLPVHEAFRGLRRHICAEMKHVSTVSEYLCSATIDPNEWRVSSMRCIELPRRGGILCVLLCDDNNVGNNIENSSSVSIRLYYGEEEDIGQCLCPAGTT
mmetsp:Transcript_6003/g.9345  ORF Transcript_6003/g.9345 Transcript_6003/m.9345 type:complete len:118 (-) Transcript_6003:373-726(-)